MVLIALRRHFSRERMVPGKVSRQMFLICHLMETRETIQRFLEGSCTARSNELCRHDNFQK